VGPFYFLVVG